MTIGNLFKMLGRGLTKLLQLLYNESERESEVYDMNEYRHHQQRFWRTGPSLCDSCMRTDCRSKRAIVTVTGCHSYDPNFRVVNFQEVNQHKKGGDIE